MVTDKDGITEEVHTETGVHLEPADFTLSITQQYSSYIKQVQSGYVYNGVKHV